MAGSEYSSSPPTGKPVAIRDTLTPGGGSCLMTRAKYGESLDPSLLEAEINLNAKYDHFTAFPPEELIYKK